MERATKHVEKLAARAAKASRFREDALSSTAAEGLTLKVSNNAVSYDCVKQRRAGMFYAVVRRGGDSFYLGGNLRSAEVVALKVALWRRQNPAVDESGQVVAQPMTAAEALSSAAAEGLTLKGSENATSYVRFGTF